MPQPSPPTSSALPFRHVKEESDDISTSKSPSLPDSKTTFPLPKLRLEIRDLTHLGARAFLSSVVPSIAIEFAVRRVQDLLYISPRCPTTNVPDTRSVTLIIRSMPGVAYTTGTDLDSDHKEIHFSAEYIEGIDKSRKADEILGVLTHEMVHCYQYNGHGNCPGGLIEGIADWVRLNSGLSPPHWKREVSGKWDAGYQHTGYFLDYLEHRYGGGTISKLNEKLRVHKYEQKLFWTELLGRPVEQLWDDYVKSVNGETIPEESQGPDAVKPEDEQLVLVNGADRPYTEKESTSPISPTITTNRAAHYEQSSESSPPAGVV